MYSYLPYAMAEAELPYHVFLIEINLIYHNHLAEKVTPEIAPIDHDTRTFTMTPFFSGLVQLSEEQLEELLLENYDSFTLDIKFTDKRGNRRERVRSNSLQLFNGLEDIVEEDDFRFENHSVGWESSEAEDEYSKYIVADNNVVELRHVETAVRDHSLAIDTDIPYPLMTVETDPMNSIIQEFKTKISRYSHDPKRCIFREMKSIASSNLLDREGKLPLLKTLIKGYLVEYELFCFEYAWAYLPADASLQKIIEVVMEGIEETFNKKVGYLSFQDRRIKLLKYLEKKYSYRYYRRHRRWRKKGNYDSRKKVANSRLRIKGKFVTREQAEYQLGVANLEGVPLSYIKAMLMS